MFTSITIRSVTSVHIWLKNIPTGPYKNRSFCAKRDSDRLRLVRVHISKHIMMTRWKKKFRYNVYVLIPRGNTLKLLKFDSLRIAMWIRLPKRNKNFLRFNNWDTTTTRWTLESNFNRNCVEQWRSLGCVLYRVLWLSVFMLRLNNTETFLIGINKNFEH